MEYENTNVTGLVKDPNTKVVINKNEQELLLFKEQRRKIKEETLLKQEIESLKNRISELEKIVQTIMLYKI